MTDDYVPAPSVDSHTMPMEVQLTLLRQSSDLEESNHNSINRPQPASSVRKIYDDHTRLVDQDAILSPSNKLKTYYKFLSVTQIKTWAFYQALISEFIGTFLLTLVCTSTGLPITHNPVPDLNGALASGFIVATIIVGLGHTSGAHINPAVTITFLVAGEIDLMRALLYIGVQLLGAVSASALVKNLAPPHAHGNLGMTMVSEGISLSNAVIVEFIITFILCYTVHAICDKRRDDIGGSKALAVGLAVVIGCLFGGPYTGASMNPARSFGPATMMNSWKNHWVYWAGPLFGSIVAALMYKHVLKQRQPLIVSHVHN